MAKYTGLSQTLTFNSVTSGTTYCLTGVDLAIDVTMLDAECAGGANIEQVAGMQKATITINGFVESQGLEDLFGASGAFLPRVSDTDLVWNPQGAGAGNPTVTSTLATVGSVSYSNPSNGIATFTVDLHLDDVTVAALGA